MKMHRFTARFTTPRVLLLGLLCIGSPLGLEVEAQNTPSQTRPQMEMPVLAAGQRMILRSPINYYDPLKINSILVEGKPVAFRTPFFASADWVTATDVTIKNATHKTLICLKLAVDFHQFGKGTPESPASMTDLQIGQFPVVFVTFPPGTQIRPDTVNKALSLSAGESITIHLKDSEARLAYVLKVNGATLDQVQAATIFVRAAYFDDDTRWTIGSFSKADKNNPGGSIRIPHSEFGEVDPPEK